MKTNENLRWDCRHRSAYQWRRFHASSCLICSTCLCVYASGRSYRVAASHPSVCMQVLLVQRPSLCQWAWRTCLRLERLNSGVSRQPSCHKAATCVLVRGPLSSQSSSTKSIIYRSCSINFDMCCWVGELREMQNELAADRSESWSAGFR